MDRPSQTIADPLGNSLTIMMSGNVFLKLQSESKKRRLGYIDRPARTLVVERKRGKHLHWKSNSYGFNYLFLSKAKSFDTVTLKDEYGTYEIKVSTILNNGKLHFKKQGFELQVFLALEIIQNHKISQKIPQI